MQIEMYCRLSKYSNYKIKLHRIQFARIKYYAFFNYKLIWTNTLKFIISSTWDNNKILFNQKNILKLFFENGNIII